MTLKLVGYTDRLSVAPGEVIAFMVSSEFPRYRADLVQLIHGDINPLGPGFKSREVPCAISGEYCGKQQRLKPGSYALIPFAGGLDLNGSFTTHMWVQPTTPQKKMQTLISAIGRSGSGFAIRLVEGRLSVQFGAHTVAATVRRKMMANIWYSVAVTYDKAQGEVGVFMRAIELTATGLSAAETLSLAGNANANGADVIIAAEKLDVGGGEVVGNFFNGKIDTPTLYERALSEGEIDSLREGDPSVVDGLLAQWDFSRDITSARITDISGGGYHGRTVNRPARAVAGRAWDGSEVVWKNDPAQYAAIHFHDDDLDDAGWEKSLEWRVPDDTPSGIYALHVYAEGEEDYLPFAIRPRRATAAERIVFLMPTFSYLAYGNNHMASRPEVAALARMATGAGYSRYPSTPQDKYIVDNRLSSLYDTHTDGSGCFYASWRRPIVSMRPKYVEEIMGVRVPHQLNADLHLVDWLLKHHYRFDVITDENLHSEGRALLDPYRVVLTGTHPEYWSQQMIFACQQYLHRGGRMMYMGGNGMYWVVQFDEGTGHAIEMRRAQPSAPRFFEPHPGELHLGTTGQRGAPWRNRGIPSQTWLGVLTAGAGRTGQHFERRPDSFDERAAWIFAGIGKNELIGNFKNLRGGYGAAGGEVDKVDFKMVGTPRHTMVLATSAPLDSTWAWDPIDQPNSPRSDMALLEYPNGGSVFSVSSIAWCSCLSYNAYNNNVSRLTRNVLNGFLER